MIEELSAPTRLAYLGLGGNLSAPDQAINQALEQLGQTPAIEVTRVSSFWRTEPIDAAGPEYCNAAAELKTTLTAQDLLRVLWEIERLHGRVRSVRNAPRTLDLDVIAMEGEIRDDPLLTLPHPRAHERAFVLLPLCEINPDVMLGPARTLRSAAQWKAALSPEALAQARPWQSPDRSTSTRRSRLG